MSTPIPSIAVHLLSGVHEQFGEAENAHLHPPGPGGSACCFGNRQLLFDLT